MKKKIIVYGARVLGYHIKNLIKECGYEFSGFISDIDEGDEILGDYEMVKKSKDLNEFEIAVALGYSNFQNRWDVFQKIKNDNFIVAKLIHPKAIINTESKIGEGAVIFAGAVVDYNAVLGDMVLMYSGAIASHDTFVGSNTILSLNSTLCGMAHLEGFSFIGAGAVVVDNMSVPSMSFIKAGKVYSKKTLENPEVIKYIAK